MITIYGLAGSRSARAVWTLEELGLPYDYVAVDIRHRRAGGRPLGDLNPACKVPILQDGDFVLTESAAICLYLAELDPQRRLLPNDGVQQDARLQQWCSFAISELEQPLWTHAKHRFALPKRYRVPAIRGTLSYEFQQVLGLLEIGLGDREWILGQRFTVADILIADALGWAGGDEWPIDSPRLSDYLARAQDRPAWGRARRRECAN
ncbi:MAG: glutathione S-transferase family protein [Chromatiales bacterium]|jgi:glutathione S-transferase